MRCNGDAGCEAAADERQQVQRRVAFGAVHRRRGAALQQQGGDVDVALERCAVEWGVSVSSSFYNK